MQAYPIITDINENPLTEGDRVVEPYGDTFPRVGTVDYIMLVDGVATVYVLLDGDAEAYAVLPTRLELVPPAVARLTRDEARLLGTYLAGPRIWDAAALLDTVVGLTEKGMIAPVGEGPAHTITDAGRIVANQLAPVGA